MAPQTQGEACRHCHSVTPKVKWMGSNAGLVALVGRLRSTMPVLVVALSALAGCGDLPLSEWESQGGSTIDPTGVIRGTVQYFGPRPLCTWEDGKPVNFRGLATLTLFGFGDPPPPDGPLPSGALNIPTSQFFNDLSQCMPENPTFDDLTLTVSASASFTWPGLRLGANSEPRSYRITALYDRDGDYIPFFLSHNVPTFGDVLGGANVGFSNIPQEIRFGSRCDRPNGQIVEGVAVTILLPLWGERPMFEVSQGNPGSNPDGDPDFRHMDSQSLIPEALESERAYRELEELANLELNLIGQDRLGNDCEDQDLEDGRGLCIEKRLREMSLDYDLRNRDAYAWHLLPLLGRDLDGDGEVSGPDETSASQLQPVMTFLFGPPGTPGLPSVEVPWTAPIIGLTRIKTDEEAATGIPDVEFLGGINPFKQAEKEVRYPDLPVTIPPVASIELINGEDTSCDTFVYAPGNPSQPFEVPGAPVDCQELPIGDYSIAAVAGIAGDMEFVDDPTSDTGTTLRKRADGMIEARPVGQLWIVPNDLGNEATLAGPSPTAEAAERAARLVMPSQGRDQAFKIRDNNPNNNPRPVGAANADLVSGNDDPRRQYTCEFTPQPPAADPVAVRYQPFPCRCCPPHIRQMCNIPRCEPEQDSEGTNLVTLQPTRIQAHVFTDGRPLSQITREELGSDTAVSVSLAEASAQTAAGATVVFEATTTLVTDPLAEADLEFIPDGADFADGDTVRLTYDEWVDSQAPPSSIIKAPVCDENPTSEAEELGAVRVNVVALLPSCLPYLMPMGCCSGDYEFMPGCI